MFLMGQEHDQASSLIRTMLPDLGTCSDKQVAVASRAQPHQRRPHGIHVHLVSPAVLALQLHVNAVQLPLAELAGAFYSMLKSQTSGYATFDYELGPHRSADLVRLDFVIHGSPVDALSRVLHRSDAVTAARAVCQKLISAVSRQAFEVRSARHKSDVQPQFRRDCTH